MENGYVIESDIEFGNANIYVTNFININKINISGFMYNEDSFFKKTVESCIGVWRVKYK